MSITIPVVASPSGAQSTVTLADPVVGGTGGGATPQFATVGAGVAGGSGTAANFPVPPGVSVNDIILVFMYIEDGTQAVTALPSGFTEAPDSPVQVTGGLQAHILHVYWKRATGADSGTYNFTLAAAPGYRDGYAARFTGCVTSGSPFDVTASAVKTTTTTGATPAVSDTTTGANRLLVWAATLFHQAACPTVSGWTELFDWGAATATNNGLAADVLAQPTAGATGSITNTFAGTGTATAWLGALKP